MVMPLLCLLCCLHVIINLFLQLRCRCMQRDLFGWKRCKRCMLIMNSDVMYTRFLPVNKSMAALLKQSFTEIKL